MEQKTWGILDHYELEQTICVEMESTSFKASVNTEKEHQKVVKF